MTKSDFNIFVLGLVLIAVAVASYVAKVNEALRSMRTPSDHLERYSYTTNITPDLNPRIRQPKMLIVLRENRRSYSYCKETAWNQH